MGETIKMSAWVEVGSWNNDGFWPSVLVCKPTYPPTEGVKRYQVDFEVPTFDLGITAHIEAEEIIELPDGKGVLVKT